jgi:hypothetical protein
MTKQEIIDKVKQNIPFDGISDIHLVDIKYDMMLVNQKTYDIEVDIILVLGFGEKLINIYTEIKSKMTPKDVRLIREKLPSTKVIGAENNAVYAFICPYLSPDSQKYCQEKNINFIDLSGNMLLRIPGQILIQRLNRPNLFKEPQLYRNPFIRGSSRVLRVLLKSPKRRWAVSDIETELIEESQRQNTKDAFKLSISSISKTVRALEEQLLIRRDNLAILIPEPRYMLSMWAEKYRDRYKSIKQSSITANNPFVLDVETSIKSLMMRFPNLDYNVTGAAAANFIAPYVNVDRIDIFVQQSQFGLFQQSFINEKSVGPNFQFIVPDDKGVSMYAQNIKGLKIVSSIQAYLDCYARGGRDAKQAEYILNEKIEKEWLKLQ